MISFYHFLSMEYPYISYFYRFGSLFTGVALNRSSKKLTSPVSKLLSKLEAALYDEMIHIRMLINVFFKIRISRAMLCISIRQAPVILKTPALNP